MMHSFVGRYEFNPNSDILDANLNEACDPTWKNVTSTLAKHIYIYIYIASNYIYI